VEPGGVHVGETRAVAPAHRRRTGEDEARPLRFHRLAEVGGPFGADRRMHVTQRSERAGCQFDTRRRGTDTLGQPPQGLGDALTGRKLRAQHRDVGRDGDDAFGRGPSGMVQRNAGSAGHVGHDVSRRCLIVRLTTLPYPDLGISSHHTNRFGILYLASVSPSHDRSSSVLTGACPAATHTATPISPHFGSGTPTTATSATPGCRRSRSSISRGYTLDPPEMNMSDALPVT